MPMPGRKCPKCAKDAFGQNTLSVNEQKFPTSTKLTEIQLDNISDFLLTDFP